MREMPREEEGEEVTIAPCIGRSALFDSTNRKDHLAARALCAQCPTLTWCAQRAAELKQAPSYCSPLVGTWAGVLYGRPTGRLPRLDPQDEPDLTDEQLRTLHAAYVRGERDEETTVGERIYQRLRKARARKAIA
jgi:hypothetical protein